MGNKIILGLVTVASFFVISGCATTGRNYQADIDSLNSRLSALQGQISAKDEEIARLHEEMDSREASLRQAEADKQHLNNKLDAALAQAKTIKAESAKKESDTDTSYLK